VSFGSDALRPYFTAEKEATGSRLKRADSALGDRKWKEPNPLALTEFRKAASSKMEGGLRPGIRANSAH
jgi:hypothetical protein